ncbi:MAG: ferrochelatase [Betaproteobacteria bacterium]|nr:ferrochelatase [Betaproteobacteria bacterium]
MYRTEPEYTHGSVPKVGILLTNLGTPDAATAPALRRYLKEFLWDPRVVEIPRPVWWLILNGIILNTRPKKSAAKYATIWTKEGSPLKVHTERQAKLVRGYLASMLRSPLAVEPAMRYGTPSIADALHRLREAGCDRILVVPLYPQYAASTTASTFDAVFRAISTMRNAPALRTVKHFHDDPRYIEALAASVREHWSRNGRARKLVMSFHGVPRFHLDKGDPYHCECRKTGRLLAEALRLGPDDWVLTFQSRFGRAEWLQPYTQPTLEQLGRKGVESVDVMCPGFVSDCLETLEEIAMENKSTFLNAGGKTFNYIPCLNERDEWIRALCALVVENLQGWSTPQWDEAAARRDAERSRAEALALGAKR